MPDTMVAPRKSLSKVLTATLESDKRSLSFTGTGEPSAEEDVPDEIPGPAGAMGAPTAADVSTAVVLRSCRRVAVKLEPKTASS